jgi:hypothetical protein
MKGLLIPWCDGSSYGTIGNETSVTRPENLIHAMSQSHFSLYLGHAFHVGC